MVHGGGTLAGSGEGQGELIGGDVEEAGGSGTDVCTVALE